MTHRIYGQHLEYMFRMPTVTTWRRLYDEGRLSPPRTYFWETKPAEELYDLEADPDEVNNLARSAAHTATLDRFRHVLADHARRIRDVGFVPEYALHRLGTTPYEYGHDLARDDLDRVRAAAEQASDPGVPLAAVRRDLTNPDASIRYWAVTGVLARGKGAVALTEADLLRLVDGAAPGPRIVAAEALARYGSEAARTRAIDALLANCDAGRNDEYVSMLALNALNQLPTLPSGVMTAVAGLPRAPVNSDQRENYVVRLIESILAGLR
jgi:uncharacterized sulfatase